MLELLNQLDGFDSRGDVKVIMATNRIETLDPALIRPGKRTVHNVVIWSIGMKLQRKSFDSVTTVAIIFTTDFWMLEKNCGKKVLKISQSVCNL